MAYREHGMWEVLEVLRRAHRGERQRAISRTTGRSRKTIRRYLKIAGNLGWRPGQEEPDEPLAARVQARLRPGPPEVGPSESECLLGIRPEGCGKARPPLGVSLADQATFSMT